MQATKPKEVAMQSRYKLADVENLKNELELLPEVEPESREVTLKDAMRVLAPVLKEMRQRRGYTNDQLLEVIRAKGIIIAKSSLKNYLRAGRRPRSGGTRGDAQASGESKSGHAPAMASTPQPPSSSDSASTTTASPRPAPAPPLPPSSPPRSTGQGGVARPTG
jgi:hypothetical protein